jgi:hypothetical protein
MKKYILLFAGIIALGNHAFSQDTQPAGGRGGAGRAAVGIPATSIAAATQGMKKFDGYFNFYYDDKTGRILLEVDKFDTEFLYFKSLTDGAGKSAERGQASDAIAKFIKVGPKILLVEPNYGYRANTTYADEI